MIICPSSKIKGIQIEIGGNTDKLGNALSSVEKQTKNLQTELKGVNTLLKADPSNVVLLTQKQELLTQAIDETSEKLKILKESQKQVQEQFERGEITQEQYRDFQREIIATEQKLNNLKDELKEFSSVAGKQMELAGKSVQEFGTKIKDAGQEIKDLSGKFAPLSATATAGLGAAITTATSLEDATKKFISSTGKAIDETDKYRNILQSIHDNNYGEDYADIADKMRIVSNILGDLPDEQLQSVVEKTYMLEDAYGMDFQETLRGIRNLMYQYGLTSDEAFDLFVKGAQEGLDFSGELGDNVAEYVGKFKQAGYSASEYFQLLKNGSENGAYNLDKVNDAINEVTTRLADGTIEEKLGSFDKNTQKVFKSWQKGGATQKDVIDSIVKGISDCTNEQEALTMAATAFGTMGEDSNLDFIKSLTSVGDEFENIQDIAENTSNTMHNTTSNKMQTAIKKIKNTLADLGSSFLPIVSDILDSVAKLVEKFNNLDDGTKKNVATFALMAATITPLLALLGSAVNGFGSLVNGVGKFIEWGGEGVTILKSMTTAQAANNAVVSAAPYVLAATALATLITAVVQGTKKMAEQKRQMDETWVSANNLKEKHEELTEALTKENEARQNSLSSAEEEGANADILVDKIEKLSNVESKSNAQKETLKLLIQELNDIMPDLKLNYDEEKDALNMSTDAIRSNVAAQKDLIKAKAAQENLTSIASDMAKAEIENAEATKEHTKATEEYQKAKEELAQFEKEHNSLERGFNSELNKQWVQLIENEKIKKEAYENTKKVLDESTNSLTNLNDEYNRTQEYVNNMFDQAELQQKLTELTNSAKEQGIEIPQSVAQGILDGLYVVPESIDELNNLIVFDQAVINAQNAGLQIPSQLSEQLNNGQISVQDAIIRLNEAIKFNQAAETAKNDGAIIPNNLAQSIIDGTISVQDANTQLNDAIEFSKSLNEARNSGVQIPESLTNGVLNGQISVQDATKQLNDIIQNETNKTPDKIRTSGQNIGKAFADGVLSKKQEAVIAGENIVAGVDNGINKRKGSAYNTIANFGLNLLNTLRSSLKEHSPSEASTEMGEFLDEGFINGVENKKKKALQTVSRFGNDILGEMNNSLNGQLNSPDVKKNIILESSTNFMNSKYQQNKTDDIAGLANILNKYMPEILENLDRYIVLDDGTLVGKIASKMDNELGNITAKAKRGY